MRRDRLRNWERAGQWHTKCTWSSGPEPHSLQVGSRLDKVELRLDKLKRQTSDSRPWHPTSRRILKLFNLVSFGSPRVTNQCGMGLPSWMSSHPESGRREQSFRKLEYSFASVSFLTNLFHASLLQLSLRMEYSDGRLFFRINSFRVGMMPLEGVLEIRDARTWRVRRGRRRRGTLSKTASFIDFHWRCGIGEERSLGRCTPLTIVDQFGITISGFTPSFEALGRLLKKKMTKIRKSHMSDFSCEETKVCLDS